MARFRQISMRQKSFIQRSFGINRHRLAVMDNLSRITASLGLEATNSLPEHEALTSGDAPLDVPKIRSHALFLELTDCWPELSDEIKRAVLAVVRASVADRRGEEPMTSEGLNLKEGALRGLEASHSANFKRSAVDWRRSSS